MAEVPVIIKLSAQRTGQVDQVLQATRKEFASLGGSIAEIGRSAALISGGLTAGLVGVGAAVVGTAGQFEQLQAKLTSALGSGEKAARAFADTVTYAGNTSFDVQGLVAATVTLEAFGQRSREVLPLAANLAAAFGKTAEESALTVGKALSGSLEGFESLRNTYGISNAQLAQYGATLTALGGISIKSAGDLQKARQALTQIIQTRFGDAVDKQAATLFGALSNLGDALTRVSAAFGSELIPAVTAVGRGVTSVVEVFERMPGPLRQAIVVAGVLAAGLGAVTTVLLATGTATFAAVAGLTAFAAAIGRAGVTAAVAGAQVAGANTAIAATSATSGAAAAAGFARIGTAITGAVGAVNAFLATRIAVSTAGMATGVGVLGGAFRAMSAALTAARVASLAFLATPLGAALAVVTLAVGAVAASFADLKNQAQISKELDEQSRALQKVRNDWRFYADAVEHAAGVAKGFLGSGQDVKETAAQLEKALKSATPLEFVTGLEKAGLSAEAIAKVMGELGDESDKTRADMKALAEVLNVLEGKGVSGLGGSKEALQATQKILGNLPVTVQNVGKAYDDLKGKQSGLASLTQIFTAGKTKTDELAAAFDTASQRAAGLSAAVREAAKTNDVASLTQTLGRLNQGIVEQKGGLEQIGIKTGSVAALRERLFTAGEKERGQIQALLGLLEQRSGLENQIGDIKDENTRRSIAEIERSFERERLLGNENLQGEKAALVAKLAGLKEGSEEEIGILRRVAAIDETLRGRRVASAREGLEAALSAGRDSVENLRSNGEATAQQLANAYRNSIAGVQAFANANKGLIAQSPELGKALQSALGGLRRDLAGAEAAIPKEKLDALLKTAKAFTEEAGTPAEKLAGTQRAIESLTTALARGQITTAEQKGRAEEFIADKKREALALTKQIAEAEASSAKETADLRKTTLEQQNEILKTQADAGDKNAAQRIKDNEKELLGQRLDDIDREAEAEARANVDATTIAERKQLRITALTNEQVLERIRLGQKETEATSKAVDDQLAAYARLHQLEASRVGGAASPLLSLEEVGLQSTLPGFGSIGPTPNRNAAAGFQNIPAVSARIERTQTEVQKEIAQARGRSLVADQPQGGTNSRSSVVNNVTKNFNVAATPRVKKGLEQVGDELDQFFGKQNDQAGLFNGPGSPFRL